MFMNLETHDYNRIFKVTVMVFVGQNSLLYYTFDTKLNKPIPTAIQNVIKIGSQIM